MIILKKFEFDDDYDFSDEGEDEAMFQEYRKTLKMLFCSIAKMVSTIPLHNLTDIFLSNSMMLYAA